MSEYHIAENRYSLCHGECGIIVFWMSIGKVNREKCGNI